MTEFTNSIYYALQLGWPSTDYTPFSDKFVLLLWHCPSIQYLSFFCEAFSWTILDSSRFSLFHSGQVFHKLVCPLTVVLSQIFFNLTTLISYPVFFRFFHTPLDVVVHFPVFLRSIRFESFLSQNRTFITFAVSEEIATLKFLPRRTVTQPAGLTLIT